jgi:hypothetical protein
MVKSNLMSADSTRQQLLDVNLENVIVTRQRDLVDGFKVRRALPSGQTTGRHI